MKKILPICKPIITHSPPIANLFSILGVNENTKSWIMNNYIGIFIKNGGVFDNFYDRNMFFYGCPWTQVIQISREIINNICNNSIEYCKALIDNDYYVYLSINIEHIDEYNYPKYKAHNALIYGYDDEKSILYISDFFKNGIYNQGTCQYEKMELAFQTSQMNRYFVNLIYGIKLKNIDYVFEISKLQEQISDYLSSINMFDKYRTRQDEEYYSYFGDNKYNYLSFERISNEYCFGLSYYDKITELLETKSQKLLRPLDLIYEHKILMKKRILFLNDCGYISNNDTIQLLNMCDELIPDAQIIRNMYIKYVFVKDETILTTSSSYIKRLKQKDENFCEDLMEKLKVEL